MTKFVKCGRCGTVYDMHGTHGTTAIRGYCPMCGLHHSGTHSITHPVLKPSPLAAKPIDVPERTCHAVPHGYCIANGEKSSCRCWSCSECSYGWHVSDYDRQYRYCPNCGAKVVEE